VGNEGNIDSMEENGEKASLEVRVRAAEVLIACLMSRVDSKRFTSMKQQLLNDMVSEIPDYAIEAIELSDVIQQVHHLLIWAENLQGRFGDQA
jgi:hypothetical protein